MPNVILYPERVASLPILTPVVDGYYEEEHRAGIISGTEPLEDGTPVSDHAVGRQEELRLTGSVAKITSSDASRPLAAWTLIRTLSRNAEVMAAYTPWGVYQDMIIIDAEAVSVGGDMRFTLRLRQVIRVGLTRGAIVPERTAGGAADGRDSVTPRGRHVSPATPEQNDLQDEDTQHAPAILSYGRDPNDIDSIVAREVPGNFDIDSLPEDPNRGFVYLTPDIRGIPEAEGLDRLIADRRRRAAGRPASARQRLAQRRLSEAFRNDQVRSLQSRYHLAAQGDPTLRDRDTFLAFREYSMELDRHPARVVAEPHANPAVQGFLRENADLLNTIARSDPAFPSPDD